MASNNDKDVKVEKDEDVALDDKIKGSSLI